MEEISWENQPDLWIIKERHRWVKHHWSVSEILTNSTHHCQRKNSRYRARAAWTAAFPSVRREWISWEWRADARYITLSRSGTILYTQGTGSRHTTVWKRRTTSRSSHQGYVLHYAKQHVPADTGGMPLPVRKTNTGLSRTLMSRAMRKQNHRESAQERKSQSSVPVLPDLQWQTSWISADTL